MKTLRLLFSNSALHMEDPTDPMSGTAVDSLDQVVASVEDGATYLRQLGIDDLIGFLDALAKSWSVRDSELQKQYAPLGLNFLQHWFRESHLKQITDLALRSNRLHVDSFQPVDGRSLRLRAQPRGIIVHWLAGNVAMLGMLSLVQGLLTKNANILKVPRQNCDVIPSLLNSFSDVTYESSSGKTVEGAQLAASIAAVYCESGDLSSQHALSKIANVRVAWGSMEAVETIMNLPRRYGSEDVIFGPKTSFAVIGQEKLDSEESARQLASRAVSDTFVFDQKGCNSPHTVFVETGGKITPQRFAELLAEAMDAAAVRFPQLQPAAADTGKILGLRAEYDMRGEAYYSDGLKWTVLFSELDTGLAEPCFNRTLFVRPIDDIMAVAEFCSHLTQSVGVALGDDRKELFAERVSARGIDRIPELGAMSLYEVPWDGMFAMDRFVRWVKL